MAGLWHLSGAQLHDLNGSIYPGAKAYFYEAATNAKITVYQDYGLGTAHPNPVQANAYGIFPAVFFDETDEFYRQIITQSNGVTIPGTDLPVIPIIGPSGGGGGSEVPVDANSLFKTGDPIWVPTSGTRAGWVRCNGRTIGAASSGAAERANADCEQLFLYLWQTYSDTICTVTGGRGVSGAADWAANKPIETLDLRNKGPFGLDDMGNTAASGFSGVTFDTGNATTPGSSGGRARQTLTEAQLPALTKTTSSNGKKTLPWSNIAIATGDSDVQAAIRVGSNTDTADNHTHTVSFGGGEAHTTISPFMLGTWYMRL